jgi:hypothetical protein
MHSPRMLGNSYFSMACRKKLSVPVPSVRHRCIRTLAFGLSGAVPLLTKYCSACERTSARHDTYLAVDCLPAIRITPLHRFTKGKKRSCPCCGVARTNFWEKPSRLGYCHPKSRNHARSSTTTPLPLSPDCRRTDARQTTVPFDSSSTFQPLACFGAAMTTLAILIFLSILLVKTTTLACVVLFIRDA